MRPPRPTVRELTRRARKARRTFLGRHDRWMWEGKYVIDSRSVPRHVFQTEAVLMVGHRS